MIWLVNHLFKEKTTGRKLLESVYNHIILISFLFLTFMIIEENYSCLKEDSPMKFGHQFMSKINKLFFSKQF